MTDTIVFEELNKKLDIFLEAHATELETVLANVAPSDFLSAFFNYFGVLYNILVTSDFFKDTALVYQPVLFLTFVNKITVRVSQRVFYYMEGLNLSEQYPQIIPSNNITLDEMLEVLDNNGLYALGLQKQDEVYFDTFINPDVLDD